MKIPALLALILVALIPSVSRGASRPNDSGYSQYEYVAQQILFGDDGHISDGPYSNIEAPWDGTDFKFGIYVFDPTLKQMVGFTLTTNSGVTYSSSNQSLTFGVNGPTQTAINTAVNTLGNSLGTAAYQSSVTFATSSQGTKADSALQATAIGSSIQAYSAQLDTFSSNGSSYYLSRSNQSGSQPASTISDFSTAAVSAVTWSTLTGKPTFGTASGQDIGYFATAAQGTKAESALQSSDIGVTLQPYSSALATFSSNGSAYYLNRANHTGTQGWSTITSTPTTLSGYGITDSVVVTTSTYSNPGWITALAYSKLTGAPSIPAAQIQSDYTETNTNSLAYIRNKPVIPSSQIQSDYAQTSTNSADYIKNKPGTATSNNSGLMASGDKAKLDGLPIIQRARVQTDASGNYTWTYPVAYASGVIPIISCLTETASSSVPQGVQIVGTPTNTSCVFKVINLPSTSVLSIIVLGAPTGSQAYIHLTAMAP